jgi:hypothetical protein
MLNHNSNNLSGKDIKSMIKKSRRCLTEKHPYCRFSEKKHVGLSIQPQSFMKDKHIWNLLLFCMLLVACQPKDRLANQELVIRSGWEYCLAGEKTWHPYAGTPEVSLTDSTVKPSEWRTCFNVPSELFSYSNIDLSLKGLMVVPDIYINDSLLLTADSFAIKGSEFSCRSLLKPTGNILRLKFKKEHIKRPSCGTYPYFLWRPLSLQAWSVAHIDNIYIQPISIKEKRADYQVYYSIFSDKDENLSLSFLLDNEEVWKANGLTVRKGSNTGSFNFSIEKPKLWWSNGAGKQPFISTMLSLEKSGKILHQQQTQLGVRSFQILRRSIIDTSFSFELNEQALYLKGANLCSELSGIKPDSALTCQIIQQARKANINIIRIPYTCGVLSEQFYQLCDKNGILVWHEFPEFGMISANDYLIFAEQIKALRNHPCMAVLRGVSLTEEEKPTEISRLPEIAIKNAPHIPLILGRTPLQGGKITILPEALPSSPDITQNPKEENDRTIAFLKQTYVYPAPSSMYGYLTQVAQAEYLKQQIENVRIYQPVNMGLFANYLIDQPHLFSSALMSQNINQQPKLSQYALTNAYSHVLVSFSRKNDTLKIVSVSNALKDLNALLMVKMIDFNGNNLFVRQIPVNIKANTANILLRLSIKELLKKGDFRNCCLVAELNQPNLQLSRNFFYFAPPIQLKLKKPQIEIRVGKGVKSYHVTVHSDVLVKNLVFYLPGKNVYFSDNNFDLIPDTRTRIMVDFDGTKEELQKELKMTSLVDMFE